MDQPDGLSAGWPRRPARTLVSVRVAFWIATALALLWEPLRGTQIPPFRGREFGSGIFDRAHRTVAIVRPRTMQRNGSPRTGDDLALSRLVKRTMLPTEPSGICQMRAQTRSPA